jgi:hypothetical protein
VPERRPYRVGRVNAITRAPGRLASRLDALPVTSLVLAGEQSSVWLLCTNTGSLVGAADTAALLLAAGVNRG